jgi:hypothetical protein
MQKLRFLPLAAIGLAFGLLTACDSTSSKDAPSVSTALYVSGNPTTLQANTTYHLAGTVENVTSWSWTVVNSATGKTVATISADAPNGSGSTDVGKGSSSKLVEFTVTSAWGATGTYVITGALTGTDGSTINTTVTVTATPGGTNTSATATTLYTTGAVYDVNGPSKGAFDLISNVGVSASSDNTTKDLKDLTTKGTVFDGTLYSGNGATFVKAATTFDFDNATVESITAAYTAGTATTTLAASQGDVWIIKTTRSSATYYIAIQITDVKVETTSSTANDGYVLFDYRK